MQTDKSVTMLDIQILQDLRNRIATRIRRDDGLRPSSLVHLLDDGALER